MKKITLALIFSGMALFSCQKTEFSGTVDDSEKQEIRKVLSVNDEEWSGLKSSYSEGVGITLSGNEQIGVFYADGALPVSASPQGNGLYAFSHEGIAGVEAYDYNYLMPYSSLMKEDGTARLFAVQYPGNGTFDPDYDFLLGEPSLNVSKEVSEVSIERFKRLTAPFNFPVIDRDNLLRGEAVKVVTVDFESMSSPVAADFVASFSSEYEEAGIKETVSATGSTALTALYPDGLEPVGGVYDVWFSSLPVDMMAGQVVSLTVTTGTRTIRCKAQLPSDFSLVAGMLNKIPFGISVDKEGYEDNLSETVCYNPGVTDLAPDGSTLAVSSSSPYVVSKLRVYAYGSSFASATTTAQIILKSGGTEVARRHFNLENTSEMNGGYVEFDGLDAYTDLSLSFHTDDRSEGSKAMIAATVAELKEVEDTDSNPVTWMNYQWSTGEEFNEGSAFEASCCVFADGVTNAVESTTGEDIRCDIGYTTGDAEPWEEGWTWVGCQFDADWGANFHFKAILNDLSAGDYTYTFRAYKAGTDDYRYAGTPDGLYDGTEHLFRTFSVKSAGSDYAGMSVTWANVQWVADTSLNVGNQLEAGTKVLVPGITDNAVAGYAVDQFVVELGYGTEHIPTGPSWVWSVIPFNADWGQEYYFQGKTDAINISGTYYCSFRIKFADNDYVYADANGLWDGASSLSNIFTVLN